jgi:hypothetical protein
MKTQVSTHPEHNEEIVETAEYCGLLINVLCRLEHCSLVRYRDHEFVINTEDLCFRRSMRCAA